MVKDRIYNPFYVILEDGLIQKRIDEIEELKKREKKITGFHMIVASQNQQPRNNIKWIENGILQNLLPDHRTKKQNMIFMTC
jgi:hypothetical protein